MNVVIAHNNTGSSINIDDLGIILSPSEIRNLTDVFDFIELTESEDLRNYINDGTITINDGTTDLNIQDSLNHIYVESEYLDGLQDAQMPLISLPAVDVANTTTISVNTTWTDIPFPTTDLQNNVQVIEHNVSDNSKIDIKEDGIYRITVNYSIRNNGDGSNDDFTYYRIINSGADISGERSVRTWTGEILSVSDNIVRALNANDIISTQARINNGSGSDILYTRMNIVKLEGLKGEQGPAGGTTVQIQHENSPISSNVDKLNFAGNLTVTDNGSGKSTIYVPTPVLTNKFINVFDSAGGININILTDTAYNWDSQLVRDVDTFDHSTNTNKSKVYVKKDGMYKLSYCVSYDGTNSYRRNIKIYLKLNGTTIIKGTSTGSYVRNNYDDYGSNTLPAVLAFLTNGDYIELMYHREGSGGSALTYADQCWLQMEFIRG